jgi:hypothetical protein
MWALVPRILLRRSNSKPLITAITTISAMTPTATPAVEIIVITEMERRRRRARR